MNHCENTHSSKPEQTTSPEAMQASPGSIRTISTKLLNSGQPYQRDIRDSHVRWLMEHWDERCADPITVSLRDDKYNIVDGQHRVEAKRRMNGGKDLHVRCIVHTGLTYEKEAELYFKLDQAKTRLTRSQSIQALSESHTDAEVNEIQRRLEDAGFVWALGRQAKKPYEIEATRAVINAYELLGGETFTRMLNLLAKTWQGTSGSVSASMFSGMALFLKTYETEVKDHVFIDRLSEVEPGEIIRRGKVDFSTNRAALRYARVIRDKYNGHRPGGRKLAYKFKG